MQLWIYSDAKAHVEESLDIAGENVVDDTEMMRLFNAAVNEAENTIHGLYQDYFLTSDYVSLVSGTASYVMPSDIFGNKLRVVTWHDGTESYEVRRIKIREIVGVMEDDDYRYNIENASSVTGTRFVIYPTPTETTSTKMRRWYVRNATPVTTDSSLIDIPEFIDFILYHVKHACAIKIGHPLMAVLKDLRDDKKVEMVNTLTAMVEDGDDDIEADTSFYDDSVA
jgi:hypothetical protein